MSYFLKFMEGVEGGKTEIEKGAKKIPSKIVMNQSLSIATAGTSQELLKDSFVKR